jgi:hypothetical protein
MKQFLAIGLLIVAVSSVSAQTNDGGGARAVCTMTIGQAPVISGIKLGMTTEQLLALFPGSREDKEVSDALARPSNQYGASTLMIRPEKYASKAKFAGVSQINFSLLDGHLATLTVNYNGPEWKHVDQFVTKFSGETHLPAADAWEAQVGMDTQLKILKCKDFEVTVFAGGKNVQNINYVIVRDAASQKTLKERKEKAREANKVRQAIPGTSLLP